MVESAENPAQLWSWRGNELFGEDGQSLALVRSDVIYFGDQRLLVESVAGPIQFRARATTGEGEVFTLLQSGFTVQTLSADCAGRSYQLRRSSVWRKERNIIGETGTVATVRPLISGRVDMLHGPAWEELPLADAVFLSWGCVLVDSPVRRPRV
ncbi:hypothetical protein [Corynebacterium alimapuense]|uniref:Uncharacterized protein n=1 Tax=Corynebacterium alimapuense TaxID=1576874 RepID=A0A3M8K8L6_9CORY|nr:hypothetical protein [Corynebacterium alimapuense]RNE49577.1 hypothetical protein C5L39_04320 [Corynebacterium alimapuense]